MLKTMPDLSVTLTTTSGATLHFKNPLTVASGTFGYGLEYMPFADITTLGALTTKALTLQSRPGNSGQRIIETPAGLINSIGLMNPGAEAFCRDIMPRLRSLDNLPVIVNISGETVADYAALAERLSAEPGITALEVNISCPNVKAGGMTFGASATLAAEVTAAVRRSTSLPIFVKLTPNVTDIKEIALAVEHTGADGISLINTMLAMAIDTKTRKPILDAVFGGLSGPAIRPIALRMVYQVRQATKLPIIGMGGIATWEDALHFILAGANLVAVGSSNFANPAVFVDIMEGLRNYCSENGVERLSDLSGAAH